MGSYAHDTGHSRGRERPVKLGGFKISKGLSGISVHCPLGNIHNFLSSLKIISQEQINLPYLTFSCHWGWHGYQLLSEKNDLTSFINHQNHHSDCWIFSEKNLSVLSLFPHRNDLSVLIKLLETIRKQNIHLHGLASSPSALSVVMGKRSLEKLTYGLFGPFSFSSYRTPSDWKLAQRGKEKLFKEVVASYQEKRPKIYGLECWRKVNLIQMKTKEQSFEDLQSLCSALEGGATKLIFITSAPIAKEGVHVVSFCLNCSSGNELRNSFRNISTQHLQLIDQKVVVLNMTGPHFGDRFGLAYELFQILSKQQIRPLALSCTVASMGLVVHENQAKRAIVAIGEQFDTPGMIEKY